MLLALGPATLLADSPQHYTLAAAFNPPVKRGGNGAIAITFTATDPDVHINETPAPRLALDAS